MAIVNETNCELWIVQKENEHGNMRVPILLLTYKLMKKKTGVIGLPSFIIALYGCDTDLVPEEE